MASAGQRRRRDRALAALTAAAALLAPLPTACFAPPGLTTTPPARRAAAALRASDPPPSGRPLAAAPGPSAAVAASAASAARGPPPKRFGSARDAASVPSFGRAAAPSTSLFATPGVQGDDGGDGKADSASRRRIVFSLLASAAASSVPSSAVARTTTSKAVDTNEDEESPSSVSATKTVVLKAPTDDREYEAFALPNGLRVLLCSDPTSNEAAAAMDVHVGACSDPDDVPGLAHFNEHMLFLGTSKYPQEDSFSSFLTSNGGSSNAFTDSEDTVYYFDLEAGEDSTVLAQGLDRFGSFFTDPTFTPSATGRELNAIESENAKNLQNDVFRMYQIEKSRSNKDHPYSKFFTGNKSTLLDGTKKKGIDLREELVKFYGTYYSAERMTLAVVGPFPLEELKTMVVDAFGEVPKRGNSSDPESKWAGKVKPFDDALDGSVIPSYGHVVEIVPIQELRQVSLTWPIIYESDEVKRNVAYDKPSYYVAHLLGHEGPGSLLSYLKGKGWANALGASTNADLSDFETFEVTVDLTNAGLNHVDEVCESIFSYVQMMKDGRRMPNYVFDEVLQLAELEWRFLTKGNVNNYATSLSQGMRKFPEESLYVAGPRRLALRESYDGKLLSTSDPRSSFASDEQRKLTIRSTMDFVDRLNVDNAMAAVISKSFEGKTDKVEKWYKTKYDVRPIPSTVLAAWRDPPRASDLGMAFPKRNVFVPTEKGLVVKRKPNNHNNGNKGFDGASERAKARSFEYRMKPVPPPVVVRDDGPSGRWTVHYKPDERFGQPKAYVILQLLTGGVYSDPAAAVLARLYQACAADKLDEYSYDASLAGLSYDIQVLPRGVRLTFGGYNDKLPDFAAYVSDKLSRDVRDVLPSTDAEFDRYKDNVMRGLNAFDAKQPYGIAIYYSNLCLQPRRFAYDNRELREAARKTTLPDLIEYAEGLWREGKGVALVQGNFNEREALKLVETVDRTLGFKTIDERNVPGKLEALPLPPVPAESIPTKLTVPEPNVADENACSQMAIQSLSTTERDHVLIELVSAVLDQPFYDDLRTQRQLGYIVSSGVKAVGESRTLNLVVQSSVYPPERLTREMVTFLDGFRSKHLERLTKGDFAVYVKGLIDRKTEPDKTLAAETSRNWGEIVNGRYKFDRVQREASALLDLTKEDLLHFWDGLYAEGGGDGGANGEGRRILITEVAPRSGPASPERVPPSSTGYARGEDFGSRSRDGTLRLGPDDVDRFRRDREPGPATATADELSGKVDEDASVANAAVANAAVGVRS